MRIGIIDYGSGNLHSVEHSVAHAASTGNRKHSIMRITQSDELASCDYIILPGVGHYADCWSGLSTIDGMIEALGHAVLVQAKPFLGICVGMQLLADKGYEGGKMTSGLGWLAGEVRHFSHFLSADEQKQVKIPHMGWNQLHFHQKQHRLCQMLSADVQMYFVHSYLFDLKDERQILATAQHGCTVPALIGRDNIAGTQFHPEKSQHAGQILLDSFLTWRP